jgi:hypothetical protein
VHDGMRAVDALEPVVVPCRLLGALVLAVADLDRHALQRLCRARGVEDQLDHLPVALVQVVPVVEDVEQPVLERELARVSGVGRDVRVDGGRVPDRQPPLPVEVVAARVERTSREVEVVLVETPREILGGRADLDHAGVLPGSAQCHRRLVEEQVDGDRHVRIAGLAVRVGDEPDDGRVPLGQGRLLRPVGERGRRQRERQQSDEKRHPHRSCSEAKTSRPSRRDRKAAASWPLTLFPASSSSGAKVPRPPLPGATVTMPPPMPLLPGRPMS